MMPRRGEDCGIAGLRPPFVLLEDRSGAGLALLFADPAEKAVTQGLLMGSVTSVITILMLLLVFFNHPHGSGVGRLQPTAMERTLRLIDLQAALVGLDLAPPCDDHGRQ